MTITYLLQYLLLVEFVAALVLCVWMYCKQPARRLEVIMPLTWSLNGVLFYGAVLTGILPPGETAILLSAALWLHSVSLVLGGLVIYIWQPNRGNDSGL